MTAPLRALTSTGRVRPAHSWYPTPIDAVRPLVPHLPERGTYVEPCAGDGALIQALAMLWPGGRCLDAYDLNPRCPTIRAADALRRWVHARAGLVITNPPFAEKGGAPGDPMVSLARALSSQCPTWLLLPAATLFSRYWTDRLASRCSDVVPIGRVRWIAGSTASSTADFAWVRLSSRHAGPTIPHPRTPTERTPR